MEKEEFSDEIGFARMQKLVADISANIGRMRDIQDKGKSADRNRMTSLASDVEKAVFELSDIRTQMFNEFVEWEMIPEFVLTGKDFSVHPDGRFPEFDIVFASDPMAGGPVLARTTEKDYSVRFFFCFDTDECSHLIERYCQAMCPQGGLDLELQTEITECKLSHFEGAADYLFDFGKDLATFVDSMSILIRRKQNVETVSDHQNEVADRLCEWFFRLLQQFVESAYLESRRILLSKAAKPYPFRELGLATASEYGLGHIQ